MLFHFPTLTPLLPCVPLYVATNGYITFGTKAPHDRRDTKPITGNNYDVTHPLSSTDDTGYDGAISALTGNLIGRFTSTVRGELRYQTIGAAPNRVFVVQWSDVFLFGDGSGRLNFQIRLHETTNAVEFAYGPCAATRTDAVQVGLRGYDPGDFNTRTGTSWPASTAGATAAATMPATPAAVPVAGLRYTFTPPALPACPQAFSLVATDVRSTTATLTWRTNGPSPGPYDVVYGPAGFDPATAVPVSAPASGLAITGLQPFTDYDFYVTQRCGGAAGGAARSVRGRFKTTLINDDPVGAVPLPIGATCQPVASTLAGATFTTAAVAPGYDRTQDCSLTGTGTTGPANILQDVWFTFTTAATGPASTGVSLQAVGATAFRLRVFSSAGGAAGPFVSVFCARAQQFPVPGFGPVIVAPLQPGTTYYAAVSTTPNVATGGPFTICATVPPACADPTAVRSNVFGSTATTATLTFVPGSGATSYTVTYAPVGGGAGGTVSPAPTGSPVTITGLTPATDYTLTLVANCAATNAQSAPQTVTTGTRPANATPATAQALPIGTACQPVPGSTRNAIFDFLTPSRANCQVVGGSRIEAVWYSFVTAASGPGSQAVRVLLTGSAREVHVLTSAGGAAGPFTEVACVAAPAGQPLAVADVPGLTPNTAYYLLVNSDPSGNANGPFTICLTGPPACGTPQGVAVSGLTTTGANLTFIGGTPAATGGYTVSLTAQGGSPGPPQASPGTSGQIVLSGLLAGTFYTATLVADCGAGGLALPVVVPFRTLGPPANDACANAPTLACGQPLRGLLDGATADPAPAPGTLCGTATVAGPGVWYRFAGTGDDVTFSTCGSPALGRGGAAHRLHVFTGTCAAPVCAGGAGADAACGNSAASTHTVATVAGTPYLIFVSAAPGTAGEFVLTATCRPAGSCPPPTAPALVLNAAGTQATATFGAAPGAMTHLAWMPVGSPGTQAGFVFASRSPALLQNLTPGLSYVLTLSTDCGNGSRSVPVVVPFSTVLSARPAALAALIELFPNPAHGTAALLLPPALRGAAATATLHNALGQAVRETALPAGAARADLDLRGLPPGSYLLRLPTAQGTLTKRLSVE